MSSFDSVVSRLSDLSDDGKELLSRFRSSDESNKSLIDALVLTCASSVTNLDDCVLAGYVLIKRVVDKVKSVSNYMMMNRHLLSPEVLAIMSNPLYEQLVSEYEYCNYTNIDYFSASTLLKGYLLYRGHGLDISETPVLKNLRIAIQLHKGDFESVRKSFISMSLGKYTHSSPTIFNSGMLKPQLASCFLMEVQDSLESITRETVGDMSVISNHNGGIGVSLSKLRHSTIGYSGHSSGVIPAGRVYDKLIEYVDQGGKRRGAATAFLDIAHIDIMSFISSTDNFGSHETRFSSLNTCIWMRDLFYKRLEEENGMWTVFCPSRVGNLFSTYGPEFETEYKRLEQLAESEEEEWLTVDKSSDRAVELLKKRIVFKKIPAKDIMKLIVSIQGKSGNPYMMNADSCNLKSNQQNLGPINGSNLCLEILEVSGKEVACCNLASINLSFFASSKYKGSFKDCFDFDDFGKTVREVVRNLDSSITTGFYPLERSRAVNDETRPLGIGVSGLDDVFKIVDLVHGSDDSRTLNKMIFACMYYNALLESIDLAKKYGPYKRYNDGSYKLFSPEDKSWVEYKGCPLSNGHLSFDLWRSEAAYRGKDFDESSMIINPIAWGQDLVDGQVATWNQVRTMISRYGVRNSLLIALMPTATTAHIMRNAESTEAHQANIYSRQVNAGNFIVINRHLKADLREVGLNIPIVYSFIISNEGSLSGLSSFVSSKLDISDDAILKRVRFLEDKYKTMFEIPTKINMLMSAERGIYVDQSQSMNIFIKNPSTTTKINMHKYANSLGLKTGMYYLRQLPTVSVTGFNIPASVKDFCSSREDCSSCSS